MNRRALATTVISAALALSLGAFAEEKKAEAKEQTTCPVMGSKIIKTNYADVKGKRIYVCCPPCIDKVKADPDKYIKQMEAEGIVLDKAPEKEDHNHDHSGHKH